MSQPLFVTGLGGLIGTTLAPLLNANYTLTAPTSRELDISHREAVDRVIQSFSGDWILHMAAYTDVDGCEENREKAHRINVLGTEHMVAAATKYRKKVCFISTDFVFDGTADMYDEASATHPLSVYAKTKREAEKIIETLPRYLIVRIAYPYGARESEKKDFVQAIKKRLENDQSVKAPDDNFFTPTYIPDIARAITTLLHKDASGIFHVVGSSSLSSFDAAVAIARVFSLDFTLVQRTKHALYYNNRAPRPQKLVLKNDKIQESGVLMKDFLEGLHELQKKGDE